MTPSLYLLVRFLLSALSHQQDLVSAHEGDATLRVVPKGCLWSPRGSWARSSRPAQVLALALLVACEPDEPLRRRAGHEHTVLAFDAGEIVPEGGYRPPPEDSPDVVLGQVEDLGASQCPSLRLARVERRHRHEGMDAGINLPALRPRLYGRTDTGRFVPLREVLSCELRMMHWVTKPINEGIALILLRGPDIFEPDSDCDWREPVRTERTPRGRRLYLRERCRRRAVPGPAERTVIVEVSSDYTLTLH